MQERAYMKSHIQKWGNSLALRIPKSFAVEAGLHKDTPVEISLTDGKLMVTPAAQPGPDLEQLLARITDKNLHHEIDTGPIAGNEIW
jgi:antitoxin MazE